MAASSVGSIGLGASLGGGLLSAFGAEKSGEAQQNMYNYQAAVARINAQIDMQNKDYVLNQGGQQSIIAGLKGAQQFGSIVAAQGANNIDVSSGSAKRVQDSQRALTSLDLTQIRSNAAKTAYDFDVKSTMDLNQSTLDIMAGQNAKLAGDIGAASSILGTVGSVSTKWLQGSKAGLFS